jgi:hypothetical protein
MKKFLTQYGAYMLAVALMMPLAQAQAHSAGMQAPCDQLSSFQRSST